MVGAGGRMEVTPEILLLFTAPLGLTLNPPRMGWPRVSQAVLQGAFSSHQNQYLQSYTPPGPWSTHS